MNQQLAEQAAREALRHVNQKILSCSFGQGIPTWCRTSKPYLRAIVDANYGWEDPVMCVLYALNNLHNWRGPDARRIKQQLNEAIK